MGFESPVNMNDHGYKTILINGQLFQGKSLNSFCLEKLSDEKTLLWDRNLYRFMLDWISDDPFIEVKTSGSTGSPKWINIEKDKMIQSALMTGRFFKLKKNDKVLLCLPVEFIAGKMMVVRSFVLRLNLIVKKPTGNPLEETNELVDFAAMTPMQVSNILSEKTGVEKLNKIAKLIIGGADIHPELLQNIRLLKNETWQTYGMTETITHVAVRKLNPPGETEFYHALPGVKFEQDERDCLIIQAPHLSETKVITNDIVKLIRKTTFKFIGRYDNVINSGGIKLSPEEIEEKLNPFLSYRFIVAGIPDEKLGQKLILVIEGRESVPISLQDLAAKANLAKFETPKQIIYTSPFPTTDNGKIIRSAIVKNIIIN
jgi:O-succinylbenzoic acid--CoA ligase